MLVYIITNRLNNKVYIGQTNGSLADRWERHLEDTARGSTFHIHNAIRYHGPEAFDVRVWRECKTRKECDEAEELAIFLYNSNHRNYGYNMTFGGQDHKGTPNKYSKSLIKKV